MADVIDLAINKYLWDAIDKDYRKKVLEYSCNALVATDSPGTTEIMDFLRSIGMPTMAIREFRSIPFGPKRQYARALWLTWAAMIAREEGKTL